MELYDLNALQISRLTTRNYSTSFSAGVASLNRVYRMPVYAIYGFVRYADEIVDTFHDQDQKLLLEQFRKDTFNALERKFSTNPILHSYQWVVNEYRIDHELIHAFLDSMEMDLVDKSHDKESYQKYIYGSAEVVGLMCLRVFYKDDDQGYEELKQPARKLGEAFQKINFLRDIRSDFEDRGRNYFPEIHRDQITDETKHLIEQDIQQDFHEAYQGISKLKRPARLGVLVAYTYYLQLFAKIKRTQAAQLIRKRYRIPNWKKLGIFVFVWLKFKLRLA
jgi:phytoene/squalene synthetase